MGCSCSTDPGCARELWAGGRSASPAGLELWGLSPPAAELGHVPAAVGPPHCQGKAGVGQALPTHAAGKHIAAHSTWVTVGVPPGPFRPFMSCGLEPPCQGQSALAQPEAASWIAAGNSRLLMLLGEDWDPSGARTPEQAGVRGRLVLFIKHHVVNHHQNVTMIKIPFS